jgi:hypothetical protein
MSTLLDLLGAQMTEPERQALYQQVLLLRPTDFAPGDLIRAETFRLMRADINEMMLRLARLEANAGGPYIDRIEPLAASYATGSKITIVGRNLKPSNADTKVSFGTKDVFDFFPESTDNQIVMPVPIGFTTLPTDVMVKVSTAGMVSNEVPMRIVAPQITPQGTLDVRSIGGALGLISVGKTYTIQWRILSQLNVRLDVVLEALVSGVTGSTEGTWLDNISLSSTGPFALDPGASQDITMTVTVPTGAQSASIALQAKTTESNFTDIGTAIPLVVGETIVPSDPRAAVTLQVFPATAEIRAGAITIEGQSVQGLKMQPGKSVSVPMQVAAGSQGGGFYTFEATVEPGSDANGPQTGRWTIGAFPAGRTAVAASQIQPFEVPLTSSATADITTVSWLTIKAKHFAAQSGGSSDFTSYTRIPIIGKA